MSNHQTTDAEFTTLLSTSLNMLSFLPPTKTTSRLGHNPNRNHNSNLHYNTLYPNHTESHRK